MGEPVVYVPVGDSEALDMLTANTTLDLNDMEATEVIEWLRSNGYFICRAEP